MPLHSIKFPLPVSATFHAWMLTLFSLVFLPLAAQSAPDTDTPLEVSMNKMKTAYKSLTTDLKSPMEGQKEAYLNLAKVLKDEAAKAHDLVPALVHDQPADQQEAMTTAYRKSMDEFMATVDSLIQSIKDSKWSEAQKCLAILKGEMTQGHKQFRKEE